MPTPPLSHASRAGRRPVAAIAGLLITLACTDVEAPTASSISVSAANAVAVGTTAAASAGIEDALDRITPALTDDRAAKPLQMALESLIDALSQQAIAPATAALERAERTLDAYSVAVGGDTGDAADLDAIALALARARADLDTLSR